ncbi:16S rRNA methyltransferase [Candidatus Pyrohabitans sp.]
MLHVVIAEAEVEPVPASIAGHPVIRREARRRRRRATQMLLDASRHHAAMRSLSNAARRGRPDIAHYTLLVLLESPLNRQGLLRCYLHTRNDEVVFINPETRLPRACERFRGLMEKLFAERRIAAGDKTLLELRRMSLLQLVEQLSPKRVVLLSERGRRMESWELAEELSRHGEACILIGGFPHGDFKGEYPFERVSIFQEPLAAWSAASEVVSQYRRCIENAQAQPQT